MHDRVPLLFHSTLHWCVTLTCHTETEAKSSYHNGKENVWERERGESKRQSFYSSEDVGGVCTGFPYTASIAKVVDRGQLAVKLASGYLCGLAPPPTVHTYLLHPGWNASLKTSCSQDD